MSRVLPKHITDDHRLAAFKPPLQLGSFTRFEPSSVVGRDLQIRERDPQRAGDLDIYIHLVLPGFKPTITLTLRPTERVRP
jgi:hypothetical protein